MSSKAGMVLGIVGTSIAMVLCKQFDFSWCPSIDGRSAAEKSKSIIWVQITVAVVGTYLYSKLTILLARRSLYKYMTEHHRIILSHNFQLVVFGNKLLEIMKKKNYQVFGLFYHMFLAGGQPPSQYVPIDQ